MDIQTEIIKQESKEESSKLSTIGDSLSIKNEPDPTAGNQSTPSNNLSNSLELTAGDLNSANLSNPNLSNSQAPGLNQQQQQLSNLNNSDDLLKGVSESAPGDFNSSNGLIKNEFGNLRSDLPDVKSERSSPNSSILTSNKLNKTNSNNVVPNNGNMSMPCNNLNSNLGNQANMNSGIMMNGAMINNAPINSSSISNSPINSSINSSASSTPNLNTTSSGSLSNSNAGNLNNMNCKMQPPPNGNNHLNNMNSMNGQPNMAGNLPGNGMSNAQMTNMSNNLNNMNMNSSLNNPNMPSGMPGGPPNNGPLPNNLNSLNANAKNSSNKFDSQYVPSNLVYVFGTQLANEAAEAVLAQKADTMISYHAGLSRTQKFLEENLLKNQPPQQMQQNWPAGNKRSKHSPSSMNGQPPSNNPNNPNNSMSPYAYRPPSNSSVVSNASYRPGPSPGIPNDPNNWNGPPGEMGNNLDWQSPQHPNSSNFAGNNPNMRPSMNSNQMPNNGSGSISGRQMKLERLNQLERKYMPHMNSEEPNYLGMPDGQHNNWPGDLSEPGTPSMANGNPYAEGPQMKMYPVQAPPSNPPTTTGRRRKNTNQNNNHSHISPISHNSSALSSPNPNIAPSPNQRHQNSSVNPPPYSPANSMRLPPYASPGPSTPSSMDGSMMGSNKNSNINSPMHHMHGSMGQMDQQLGQAPPLSPAAKKCKNLSNSNLMDNSNLDNSVGSDFMNSSLPNNSNRSKMSEPQLMPVPSPQKIQYLQGFEGQELTIQKQPNTSLPESELMASELEFMNNLDYMNNPVPPQQQPPNQQMPPGNLLPNMVGAPNQPTPPQQQQQQQQQQFINGPNRMPPMNSNNNSPYNNNPHLQQQQMPSQPGPPPQLMNQPPPNSGMIGADNGGLGPNNPGRFNPNMNPNSNQFDPRMQPFCSPNQPPLGQSPNMPPNSMYSRMPNSSMNQPGPPSQFKNQLIINPSMEPPMGSNHLQSLQKMAHTFDDGPTKFDNPSSLNSSIGNSSSSMPPNQFDQSGLMNSGNSGAPMMRSNSMNDPMSCNPGSQMQPGMPGRMPNAVGGPGNLPPYSQMNAGPNSNQFHPMNPSEPNYQGGPPMHPNMPPQSFMNNQPMNSNPGARPSASPMLMNSNMNNNSHNSNFPLSNSVSPKLVLGNNMSPSPVPPQMINGQRVMPNQYPGGGPPPQLMQNPGQRMPGYAPNFSKIPPNVQINNAKPSTIGYLPPGAGRPPTGAQPPGQQQQQRPNLEFLPRYPLNSQQPGGAPHNFQPNNGVPAMNSMPNDLNQGPGRPPNQMMMQRGVPPPNQMPNDTMISNQPMYNRQNGPPENSMQMPPMNGGQPPNSFNCVNPNSMPPQSFPGNQQMMGNVPNFVGNKQPQQPPPPQQQHFYPNDPNYVDNAYPPFQRHMYAANNQSGGN